MGKDSHAPEPQYSDDIVLLAGAGASSYLGLPDLGNLLDRATLRNDEIAKRIRETSNAIRVQPSRFTVAVFEELIARIRHYIDVADMLRTEYPFRMEFGQIPHGVDDGTFQWKWKQALIRCYRVFLEEYGPKKIDFNSVEFHTTLKLLKGLAESNSNKLHIYTTNYDCSYQVLASNCEDVSFLTHINNENGEFEEKWFAANPNIEGLDLPQIYVHRLHGCVAWYTDDPTPFRVVEAYGSGDILEILDDDYLSRMCIKLVVSQLIGENPAFVLGFREFSDHLKNAKILLVWGYSFRDLEVLRSINLTFFSRKTPLRIYYIDPFLKEMEANKNIHSTLLKAPVVVSQGFRPKRINWNTSDGHNELISRTTETLGRELDNVRE